MPTYSYETKNNLLWPESWSQARTKMDLSHNFELKGPQVYILKWRRCMKIFQSNVPDRWGSNQVVPGSLATSYRTLSRSAWGGGGCVLKEI